MAGKLQVAALPWRRGAQGVEVLMVTTRTTRRWVIPKGWPMPDRADNAAAAQEALEEAGVTGHVSALPFGKFSYIKQTASGKSRLLTATVFTLEVTGEAAAWHEQQQRERRWLTPDAAAAAAGEPELAVLLAAFARDAASGLVVPRQPDAALPPVVPGRGFLDRFRRWLAAWGV